MKYGITFAIAVVMAFAAAAKAELVFQKQKDKSVVLTLNEKTATITKTEPGKSGTKLVLIDGKIEESDSSLVIVPKEGDVCPPVSVELYHDAKLSGNMLAEVRNKMEDAGSAALNDCGQIRVIDGWYSRVK